MKRRTLSKFRNRPSAEHHHCVYVVLLQPQVRRLRKARLENPQSNSAPCVYVGMTGLDPAARFANHKLGLKAASIVQRFGIRLLPELYAHLNPMPYAAAAQMEQDLAQDLRQQGYTVFGGH